MVERSKRLKWGYTGRLRYLLQLIGSRAYGTDWTDISLKRYKKIERAYNQRNDRDDEATYP